MSINNVDITSASFPLVGAQPVEGGAAQAYDGLWLLLDASGQAVPHEEAALKSVSVSLRFGYMVLQAPGMLRLDVPLDVIEDDESVMQTITLEGQPCTVVDEGVWAAEWFTQVLGRPARLVKRVA